MLRIELLSADAQAVLRVAAAAGPSVRHGLLVAATPLEPDALLAGVREAVAHHDPFRSPAATRTGSGTRRARRSRRSAAGGALPIHASLGHALSEDPSLSLSGRGVAAELSFHCRRRTICPPRSRRPRRREPRPASGGIRRGDAHFERAAELWTPCPNTA